MHFWAHDSFENVAQGLTAGLDAMEKQKLRELRHLDILDNTMNPAARKAEGLNVWNALFIPMLLQESE